MCRQIMSKLSRSIAIEIISNWNTAEVIKVLTNNGLEDCCRAVLKREIDGDGLLHLTENNLTLWKRDLTRSQIWNLLGFVEKLNNSPENYAPPEEIVSDSGSWYSDFSDEDEEEEKQNNQHQQNVNLNIKQKSSGFHDNLMIFKKTENDFHEGTSSSKHDSSPEMIYMNCETQSDHDEENTYMNYKHELKPPAKQTTESNSLAEMLKKELESRSKNLGGKPEIGPKPSHNSFLHKKTIFETSNNSTKDLISSQRLKNTSKIPGRADDLPRPPLRFQHLDLLSDLPKTQTEDSDDDYESVGGQNQIDTYKDNQKKFGSQNIVERNQKKIVAKNGMIRSMENFTTVENAEKNTNTFEEIYESITESSNDTEYYISPISSPIPQIQYPSIPAKPNISVDQQLSSASTSRPKHAKITERLPEKKTNNSLSHSGSSSSLSEKRATRPLPPPPERQSYMNCPWFHDITRKEGLSRIAQRKINGYFLVRPSTTNPCNPLALVLWFEGRVYNVPVRKRPDNRFALGTPKMNEQTFATVEEIVKFHTREELVLNCGTQTGSTKLTETPPK